jgi:hypothetical protein
MKNKKTAYEDLSRTLEAYPSQFPLPGFFDLTAEAVLPGARGYYADSYLV